MDAPEVEVYELTREEGIALFDRQARKRLGITGDEFLRRYDAGEYNGVPCSHPAMHMAMMIPYAREVPAK